MPVAPDWELLVRRADEMAALVDQHLDDESVVQGRRVTVETLCPEQRASIVSDLACRTQDAAGLGW